MRRIILATVLGLASVAPASAQVPNAQQFLGGLLSGNQNQDQALHQAFERGYQRGRQDEARLAQQRTRNDDRGYRRPDERGTYGDRDQRGYNPGPQQQQGFGNQGGYYGR